MKVVAFVLLLSLLSGALESKRSHGNAKRKERRAQVGISKDLKQAFHRMLMPGPPNYIQTKGMVIPQSMPQIDAPRLLINNLPRPSQDQHQYPQANMADTQGNPAPITILPPRFVSPKELKNYEKSPQMALRSHRSRRLHKHSSRNNQMRRISHRRLDSFPFINPGPGYIDVGSNGYSPMTYAAMNPNIASMSPFIPRNAPPPPIRLQLRDPIQETYKKNIMTTSEKAMHDFEAEKLKEELKQEIDVVTSLATTYAQSLKTSFNQIDLKVREVEAKKKSIDSEVNQLQSKINQSRENTKEAEAEKSLNRLTAELEVANKSHGPKERRLYGFRTFDQKKKSLIL
jgi:hypothetical protein